VVKEVPGPTVYVDRIVEKEVVKEVPGPTVYVDKIVEKEVVKEVPALTVYMEEPGPTVPKATLEPRPQPHKGNPAVGRVVAAGSTNGYIVYRRANGRDYYVSSGGTGREVKVSERADTASFSVDYIWERKPKVRHL